MTLVNAAAAANPPVKSKQGQAATNNGGFFESMIARALTRKGYGELSQGLRYAINKNCSVDNFINACAGQPSYATQAKLIRSIYGEPFRLDFAIYHPQKWPKGLLIETKYQQVAGSVDEKLPYAVMTLSNTTAPVLVLAGGSGFRQIALDWLNNETARLRAAGKDIHSITTTDATMKWLNTSL